MEYELESGLPLPEPPGQPPDKFSYQMFPESWTGRVLIALAFLAGTALFAFGLLAPVLIDAGLSEPATACAPAEYPSCLRAEPIAFSGTETDCTQHEVCLAPLGNVSPAIVHHLLAHYEDQYGLEIGLLDPIDIPETAVTADRMQVDAYAALGLIRDEYRRGADPGGLIIGIMSVDMYISTKTNWRYAFGMWEDNEAIISTVRMNPEAYGNGADFGLLSSRVRKLVSKYIGALYYHLPPSDDPKSPMFNRILGPSDLDRMTEPLPIP